MEGPTPAMDSLRILRVFSFFFLAWGSILVNMSSPITSAPEKG